MSAALAQFIYDAVALDHAAALDHNQNTLFFRAITALVDDSFPLTWFATKELFINLDDTADSGKVLTVLDGR